MNRIVTAHTPLGEEALRFRAMNGSEALSQLFEFEVELLSDSHSLDLKALLGKSLTLELETQGEGARYLDGIVARCMLVGREDNTARQYRYRATVRPWLWLLTRTQDCKIFQNQTVPQILQTVLGEYGFALELRLTGSYRQWGYCVQYQETDFAFVSRLMEHEGIYYFFQHALGSHTLVLTDDIATHEPFPGYDSVPFFTADRAVTAQEECIDVYHVAEEIAPGSYVTDDYNFTTPRARLQNQRSNPAAHEHGEYEIYDWLGGYSEHGESDHYSRIRLEELQAERERDEGHATARGLAPGFRFTLRNCPRPEANREYLVVAVTYRLKEPGYASSNEQAYYEFDFVTQPTSLPFRPRRITPKPRTNGPQTAVVVGPAGEEIWTDQYGRIKVQFRWDRYGQMDENSSCWVRVSSSWAGSTFGGMYIPRVGQEVIVDFIAGEPDRPIVIGCTYNADQMPPFGLPDSATQSGFVSRSLKGSPENANAIRFEDKPGEEELWFHAELDHRTTVERDKTHDIGNDRSETIGRHASQTVKGNKSTAILQNYDHTVEGSSTRKVIKQADETYENTWAHTSLGASTVTRKSAHDQTYEDSYTHRVKGAATKTYEAPETRTNEQVFAHTVLADHTHDVTGSHIVTIGQDHDTTVTGSRYTTVTQGHTVTVMQGSSYHTGGMHSLTAGDVTISAGSGGGGASTSFSNAVLGDGSISMSGTKISTQSRFNLDASSIKGAAAGLNVSADGIKMAGTLLNTAYNGYEFKRNEIGKKEYTFFKNETVSVEHKNVLTSYEKGMVHTTKGQLVRILGGGTYKSELGKKKDKTPDKFKFSKKHDTKGSFDAAKAAARQARQARLDAVKNTVSSAAKATGSAAKTAGQGVASAAKATGKGVASAGRFVAKGIGEAGSFVGRSIFRRGGGGN
ncbi:type VI secretion system Vgr family protein [Chitinolyticbacter meiyuanensis]|uniref:type VI secretion system Vgr family protein n=1 Tax=Chitinolyticbacter meiyuanensis TaxID=682798 RepID=UPI0011E5AA9A|nr:type VI secretion system tip protein VgrG [Chitinolyticbacter meiyuanensis]